MRLRTQVIGSLNLLGATPGALAPGDLVAAQALADVATIGILHQRAATEQRLLATQLQYALDSRIIVEQAKGVIAEHAHIDVEMAFTALRTYARNHNERLVDVAHAVAARTLPAASDHDRRAPRWWRPVTQALSWSLDPGTLCILAIGREAAMVKTAEGW